MGMDMDEEEKTKFLTPSVSSRVKTSSCLQGIRTLFHSCRVSLRVGGSVVLVACALTLYIVAMKQAVADMRQHQDIMYNDAISSMDPTFAAQLLQQRQDANRGFLAKWWYQVFSKTSSSKPSLSFGFDAVFGDNMVLQHGSKAAVYGYLGLDCTAVRLQVVMHDDYNDDSTVVFDSDQALYNVTLQPFGKEWGIRPCSKADCPPYDMPPFNPWNSYLASWKFLLPPQRPGGNYTITATCTAGGGDSKDKTTSIVNVTFGDMWYCSGQSNMWLPLKYTFDKNATAFAILDGKYSNVRVMVGSSGNHPYGKNNDNWSTENYGAAGGTNPWMQVIDAIDAKDLDQSKLFQVGATCWYFAQKLVDMGLDHVPIGLANTAIGGQRIQEFMNNATIDQCHNRTGPGPQSQDARKRQLWWEGQLYATQVLPFADMTIKGWIWYQGENNMFDLKGNAAANVGYSCEMKLLVQQWRALWSQTPGTTDPEAPFGLVTLASSGGEGGPDMGTMRLAQTANYGVLPSPDLPNTFLAQAYDLDDEWGPDLGACFINKCCDKDPKHPWDPTSCNQTLHQLCNQQPNGACAASANTPQFMGGIHPRSKKAVGDRLGIAAYNLLYGGKEAYTGPTLQGCSILNDNDNNQVLEIRFNKTLLMGDTLAEPVIPPVVLKPEKRHPPAGGSQLFVQTNESQYCLESSIIFGGTGNKGDPYTFVCPEWAGGNKDQAINPSSKAYNDGWIEVSFKLAPGTTNAIHVDLAPVKGATVTAVRYAWGPVDCCDYSDPLLYVTHNCIATCPIQAVKSKLPANPFSARIVNGKCTCVAPQVCTDDELGSITSHD